MLCSAKKLTGALRRLDLSRLAYSGVLARLGEYFKNELLAPLGPSALSGFCILARVFESIVLLGERWRRVSPAPKNQYP
jgi:hypothetical protein